MGVFVSSTVSYPICIPLLRPIASRLPCCLVLNQIKENCGSFGKIYMPSLEQILEHSANKSCAHCSCYFSLRSIEPACTLATTITVAAATLIATDTTCRSKDASRYLDWTTKGFQTTRPGCQV